MLEQAPSTLYNYTVLDSLRNAVTEHQTPPPISSKVGF